MEKLCRENEAADMSAHEWKEEYLKFLLSEYAAEDAFNVDETALFG